MRQDNNGSYAWTYILRISKGAGKKVKDLMVELLIMNAIKVTIEVMVTRLWVQVNKDGIKESKL